MVDMMVQIHLETKNTKKLKQHLELFVCEQDRLILFNAPKKKVFPKQQPPNQLHERKIASCFTHSAALAYQINICA